MFYTFSIPNTSNTGYTRLFMLIQTRIIRLHNYWTQGLSSFWLCIDEEEFRHEKKRSEINPRLLKAKKGNVWIHMAAPPVWQPEAKLLWRKWRGHPGTLLNLVDVVRKFSLLLQFIHQLEGILVPVGDWMSFDRLEGETARQIAGGEEGG